jgi:hypothetical protein
MRVFSVKGFQTAVQKLQKLDRFEDNKNIFAQINDLAFIASDVHFGNSMQEKPAFYLCGGKLLFKN